MRPKRREMHLGVFVGALGLLGEWCDRRGQGDRSLHRSVEGPPARPSPDASSQTFSRVLYETARRENMTLRDLHNLTAAARGHWVLCGTPKRIAATFKEWFVEEAADGFNDLVVPELQARGLFRREYEGMTQRDHFGLPHVPAPAR